jgi:hypothetical protein
MDAATGEKRRHAHGNEGVALGRPVITVAGEMRRALEGDVGDFPPIQERFEIRAVLLQANHESRTVLVDEILHHADQAFGRVGRTASHTASVTIASATWIAIACSKPFLRAIGYT